MEDKKNKPVDFHIDVKPVSITLTCPHCGEEVTIPWKQLNPPEYWGGHWDDVICPECGKDIELGDYDYD